MKKIMLLIMFILCASLVTAFAECGPDYIWCDTGDVNYWNGILDSPNARDTLQTQNWTRIGAIANGIYEENGPKFGNMSLWFNTTMSYNAVFTGLDLKNVTMQCSYYELETNPQYDIIRVDNVGGGNRNVYLSRTNAQSNVRWSYFDQTGWHISGIFNKTKDWINVTQSRGPNGIYTESYINGLNGPLLVNNSGYDADFGQLFIQAEDSAFYLDECYLWQGGVEDRPESSPPAPTFGDVAVQLLSPPNGSINNSVSMNFTYNVSATNSSLANCSIYLMVY